MLTSATRYDVTLRGAGPDVTMWVLGRVRHIGMAPLAGWVDRYRTFWPERIGKLKELLKDMDQ